MLETSPTPRPRWFRFGLRTMFVVLIICAIPMAWVAKERRQSEYEQLFAQQLVETGGTGGWTSRSPFSASGRIRLRERFWHKLGSRILGERILWLRLTTFDQNTLDALDKLSNLQELSFKGLPITDVSPLTRFQSLRRLDLDSTQVSDLTPIAKLTNLEQLVLKSTPVTEFTPLIGLTKLWELDLRETDLDKQQLAALRKALPNCHIAYRLP